MKSSATCLNRGETVTLFCYFCRTVDGGDSYVVGKLYQFPMSVDIVMVETITCYIDRKL